MDDWDDEGGPFARLYERWSAESDVARKVDLEARLATTLRDAWASGDSLDQWYVLDLVWNRRDPEGANIIIQGMRSSSERVADYAAVLASVTDGQGTFRYGPELRREFRAHVRRLPKNDILRRPALCGHEPGDADDWSERPFVNLYEDWRVEDYPGDPELVEKLIEMYRATWEHGDAVDRAFVLHFLPTLKRRVGGAPDISEDEVVALVREGLHTNDRQLGRTAAFYMWCMLDDGFEFGSDLRSIMEAHLERFPERVGPARFVVDDFRKQRRL